MNIGVDIKCLAKGRTGVAVYLRNSLDWLQRIDTANSYILFEPVCSGYPLHNPRWKTVRIPGARIPGTLWTHYVLAPRLARHGVEVFWEPEQLAPLKVPAGVKRVITIHDLTCKHYPWALNAFNRLMHTLYFDKSVACADRIVTVSSFVKNELVRMYPAVSEKTTAIPNGCAWDVDTAAETAPRADFLLYVGTVEPRKNLLNLVKALEILSRSHRMDTTLKIAGPAGWKSRRLFRHIAHSAIRDRIHFAGYQSAESVRQLYRACRMFVFPSLYEGFGLPVLEALASGCIVVTSRGTVMQETLGECAVYFDPRSPEDIAAKIRAVLCGEIDTAALLTNRRRILAHYSWEKSARALMGVFNGLQPLFISSRCSPLYTP